MNKLLNLASAALESLKPRSKQPTIETYGQSSSGVPEEQIQAVMEWLFASLLSAGYFGTSHLVWDDGNQDWEKVILIAQMRKELVFLYRCGDRPSPPTLGYYWRLIGEHTSLRMYQLEVKSD